MNPHAPRILPAICEKYFTNNSRACEEMKAKSQLGETYFKFMVCGNPCISLLYYVF